MCERVEAIKDYYVNLEYNESEKEVALAKISKLSQEMTCNDDKLSKRFLDTASLIKKNLSLFQSVCKHVDIVTTIIEYLNHFHVKFLLKEAKEVEFQNTNSIMYKPFLTFDEIISIMCTLFHICTENEVRLFLIGALIKDIEQEVGVMSLYQEHIIEPELYKQISSEMVLLEDSDLYAVISYLITMDYSSLSKIWVQQPIKQKFLSLMKKYNLELPIRVFRSKQELLTVSEFNEKCIVSIWSEDVVAAKILATSLNKDIVFINAHMDFCGSIILLPVRKHLPLFSSAISDDIKQEFTKNPDANKSFKQDYLFYEGTWQKPVKDTYWIHDSFLWPHVTREDVDRCVNSALKGAKLWNNKSIDFRIQVLSKFASTLKNNGEFEEANMVSKWTKLLHFYENSSLCSQNGRLEVTTVRKPRGFIFLQAEQEDYLSYQLIQALITGNSVIMVCRKTDCVMIRFCYMFSTCGIPPGVINMLLVTNMDVRSVYKLHLQTFYEELLSAKDEPEKIYTSLTVPKSIILPIV